LETSFYKHESLSFPALPWPIALLVHFENQSRRVSNGKMGSSPFEKGSVTGLASKGPKVPHNYQQGGS